MGTSGAQVGFIGLGHMGLPMAANLVAAGHRVMGFDLVADNCARAAARGVTIVSDAVAAASGAVAVFTMVPAGANTVAIYRSGVLEAMAADGVAIDCSTIDVASARLAHELAASAGRLSLDCPVSGGVGGAAAATLTLMAGGSLPAYERALPVLAAVSKRVVHCGSAGAGQAAKICNNMILGISMIAVAEAFVLGEKLGLSHEALFDVASTSSGQCWALTTNCPVPGPVPASPANRDYAAGFAAALMLKDLKLAADAARASGAQLELGPQAAALYETFVAKGAGAQDFSAIINAIRSETL
jgi:3-hydroxyisobutyrate dehydrogenase